jgi:hypothetical protein
MGEAKAVAEDGKQSEGSATVIIKDGFVEIDAGQPAVSP